MRFVALALSATLLVSHASDSFGQKLTPAQIRARQRAAQQRAAQQRANQSKRPGQQSGKKPAPKPPKSNLPSFEGARQKIVVPPLSGEGRLSAKSRAERIDRLIDTQLGQLGIEPNPPSTDEQFVRRVYLDVVGRIPTAKETEFFLRSRDPQKRERLIDRLLANPGYSSHFYNYWADVLRLVDRADNNTYLRPYSDWVKQQLRENRPYDEMVHEMLTGTGKPWENPAAGYVLRDAGMPLDNLNNTVRVFLGTRIGCAQCHDHPFDRWTQKDFYQLAALTGGLSDRVPSKPPKGVKGLPTTVKVGYNKVPADTAEGRTARRLMRMNRMAVWENPYRRLKFPSDYAYDNGDANGVVQPGVLFGDMPSLGPKDSRREALAGWVTAPDNPRFAKTIANRLWKRAFGIGLIEPVDDMQDDTVASNPELMRYLEEQMRAVDFDLREFQRMIYNTRAYQRSATMTEVDLEKPYGFPGPVLRRMTAEQAWDSLMTLTVADPDTIVRESDEEYVSVVDLDQQTTVDQLMQKAKRFNTLNRERNKRKKNRVYRNPKQIGNVSIELARASELPQPVPGNHFLRQFGQSDRQIIGDSTTDGTVPQLLTMFNGPVTHMMLEYGSVLYDEVASQKDVDDAIDAIFLSLLNRHPTTAERKVAREEFKKNGAAGIGDVVWALLNTREFLFVQ